MASSSANGRQGTVEPTQKRAHATRRRILRSARALFSSKGFHGTRVDAIAARAGVNKQRIYAYFGGKKQLFTAVLREAFTELDAGEQAFLKLGEEDIPRLPKVLLEHYQAFHEQHPHFWRLLSWENLEGTLHAEALRTIDAPPFQHLKELYRKGQERTLYPKEVSFEAFVLAIFALPFFCFANQRTMTRTLNTDLGRPEVRHSILSQALGLLNHDKNQGSA